MSAKIPRILRLGKLLVFSSEMGVILKVNSSYNTILMSFSKYTFAFSISLYYFQLFAQTYSPSISPDRIILTWETDPATSQAVSWRTDETIQHGWAEIAVADGSPDFRLKSDTLEATYEVFDHNEIKAHYFSVNFEKLKSNTKYAYRVGHEETWSEWFHFTTASKEAAPFSFIYFGDAQNEIKSMWSRTIREAVLQAPKADFMLHAGDLVNRSDRDSEWGEWFYAGGWINGMIPSIATPGNHEYGRTGIGDKRVLSPQWNPTFAFPKNGPKGHEETVYYIDYQETRFISINSMVMYADPSSLDIQKTWLEEVLSDNPNRWTIITHHHPIYSAGNGRDNERFRDEFKPIYEKYGVDLVLQGHDHTYARGGNLLSGIQARNGIGPVYVVSVSGPKMYESALSDWMDRVAMNTQLFQVIEVKPHQINYKAYTVTGELYDAFSLQKRSDNTNLFIDERPTGVEDRLSLPNRIDERMNARKRKDFNQRFKAFKERTGKN